MTRKGFFFNQVRCVGCKTCQMACKDKNDLPVGVLFRRIQSYETGRFPNPNSFHYSASCNHCSNPECVAVCPIGAMHVDEEDGTVQYNDSICIGCQYCVTACPYGNPRYVMEYMVVHKCDACKSWRELGEQPACASACPTRALEFGPIEELRAAHPDSVSDLPILPSSSKTRPSLLIKPRPSAFHEDFRELYL